MGSASPHLQPILRCAIAAVLLALAGCATKPSLIVDPVQPEVVYDWRPVQVLEGKASYYYGRWIGRKTANGEIYRATDVTAAHKTLPFNTMVRVTNLKNGKSVIVRINNRGPYIKGRILDLSLVAAQKIDMTRAGVVPVRAEVLKKIEVVSRPNLRITPEVRKRAEERARQRQEEAEKNRKPQPVPRPTPQSAAAATAAATAADEHAPAADASGPRRPRRR